MRVENLSYNIDWSKFRVGTSFFVPCLNTDAAREEVLRITKRIHMPVVTKVVIEEGIKGLRVWRVKA